MASFRREVRAIQVALAGSQWATEPDVTTVLNEYGEFASCARMRNGNRKTCLQILLASRALDSFLVAVVSWECTRQSMRQRRNGERTLGANNRFISNQGINGNRFTRPTLTDLRNLTSQRNTYLHQAGQFPTDSDLTIFLNRTISAIREVVSWR